MKKIDNFHQVIQYLNDKEIVLTADRTSFYIKGKHIAVNGKNSHYLLSYEDFKNLYQKETFYVYEPTDETVNTEKDDEYYSWKSKNAN